jgi:hypothetical protein
MFNLYYNILCCRLALYKKTKKMGKAKSIYFRDEETVKAAEEKAKKIDRSLSYYIDELVKKDLNK